MSHVTWHQPALPERLAADGRRCTRCNIWRPADGFYRRGERLTSICRRCISRSNIKPQVEIDCGQCGTPFIAARRDARYCSYNCGAAARRRAAGRRVLDSVVDGKKCCNTCRKWLPLDAFGKRTDRGGRPYSHCRPCWNSAARIELRRKRGLPDDAPPIRGCRKNPVGSTSMCRGYIIEKKPGHHRADKYGWVLQHIVIAEQKYGIRITREYTVHHVNGDRADNRPENLELRWGNHGKGADVLPALLRLPEMRAVARAVLSQYDD